jgi:hypothetical protein
MRMSTELPDEADEAPGFDALVAVLDRVAGEDVCVDVGLLNRRRRRVAPRWLSTSADGAFAGDDGRARRCVIVATHLAATVRLRSPWCAPADAPRGP